MGIDAIRIPLLAGMALAAAAAFAGLVLAGPPLPVPGPLLPAACTVPA